ncbi:isocitrate dehydrogenase (NAD+) [Fontibacillus solani]|uniref:Isocitrate dehydrogenase (NAD+) n=1 Tax=Fontibacillus solani TaxID=1572857 RepID=A0A7W3SVU8_9BACL|nr:isocitrate/isopropylmalate family dehydrogenase [Fontibacillus solani]MBA9087206.1 isocitrate dehydrogenase (NAD+) [Fontibacillus solani]
MPEIIEGVVIKGDGIGPEIMNVTTEILSIFPDIAFSWEEKYAGLEYFEKYNELVPLETLEAIRAKRVALKGPFTTYSGKGPRSANWVIRRELDLYVCMRPIVSHSKGINILLIRENTEDLYGAIEWEIHDVAHALKIASVKGCRRIAAYAFKKAQNSQRKKVTIAHKANNLKITEGMFLDIAQSVGAAFKNIHIEDQLIDSLTTDLIIQPGNYDVILTTNTFGDILSSLGAGLLGGQALVPSASINDDIVLVEGAHGSAPDLKGENIANPTGLILASAILLEELGANSEAQMLRSAVEHVYANNIMTADCGGQASTTEFAEEIKKELRTLIQYA